MTFMNVKEQWFMYDTIGVTPYIDTLAHPIPGWFSDFNLLSQTDNLSFFDSRNKGSVGLAYNNQDSTDQTSFAFVAESLSVGFFAPSIASQLGKITDGARVGRVDTISGLWDVEFPQHTSAVFRVNQDERLKTSVAMLAPGYGPVGQAMGQGDTSTVGGQSNSVHAGGFGHAHLKYRWNFPTGIGIPRRASLTVNLRFSEWARFVLSRLWGPGAVQFKNHDGAGGTELVTKPTMFMIQCLIQGKRQVQQRGEYHA